MAVVGVVDPVGGCDSRSAKHGTLKQLRGDCRALCPVDDPPTRGETACERPMPRAHTRHKRRESGVFSPPRDCDSVLEQHLQGSERRVISEAARVRSAEVHEARSMASPFVRASPAGVEACSVGSSAVHRLVHRATRHAMRRATQTNFRCSPFLATQTNCVALGRYQSRCGCCPQPYACYVGWPQHAHEHSMRAGCIPCRLRRLTTVEKVGRGVPAARRRPPAGVRTA